jgi:hypothetical protein
MAERPCQPGHASKPRTGSRGQGLQDLDTYDLSVLLIVAANRCQAPELNVSTAPARSLVSRTRTTGAEPPTSTQLLPFPPLYVDLRHVVKAWSVPSIAVPLPSSC